MHTRTRLVMALPWTSSWMMDARNSHRTGRVSESEAMAYFGALTSSPQGGFGVLALFTLLHLPSLVRTY
jgi:hypothetical protein